MISTPSTREKLTVVAKRDGVVDFVDGARIVVRPSGTSSDPLAPSPGRSRLDRASLRRIAAAGGGQYFELDRDADRDIANAIIDAGRRQAPATTEQGTTEELYWRFLAGGLALAALGSVLVRDRTELWIQLAATIATGVAIWGLIVN